MINGVDVPTKISPGLSGTSCTEITTTYLKEGTQHMVAIMIKEKAKVKLENTTR